MALLYWKTLASTQNKTGCFARSFPPLALAVFWELFCRFLWILCLWARPLPVHSRLSFFLCRSELAFFRISSYNLGRAHAKTSLSLHFREDRKKSGKEDNYDLEKEMMMTINQKLWITQKTLLKTTTSNLMKILKQCTDAKQNFLPKF